MTPDGYPNRWGIKYNTSGGISMGFWKNQSLHGNVIILDPNWSNMKEGWFEDGSHIEPMKDHS